MRSNARLRLHAGVELQRADAFTWSANDGSRPGRTRHRVDHGQPGERRPVALDVANGHRRGHVANVALLATDVDGDAITFAVTGAASHGTVTGTAPNVTYTPDTDYVGNDSFEFTVTDVTGPPGRHGSTIIVDGEPLTATIPHGRGTSVAQGQGRPLRPTLTDRRPGARPPWQDGGRPRSPAGGQLHAPAGILLCTAYTDAHRGRTARRRRWPRPGDPEPRLQRQLPGDEDNTAASDNGPLTRLFGLTL